MFQMLGQLMGYKKTHIRVTEYRTLRPELVNWQPIVLATVFRLLGWFQLTKSNHMGFICLVITDNYAINGKTAITII